MWCGTKSDGPACDDVNMAHGLRKICEDFWAGADSSVERDSVSPISNPSLGLWDEVTPGVAFVLSFGNAIAVDTAEGVVLIDTGSSLAASGIFDAVRAFSTRPIHTCIYTHGHIDHCFGVVEFDREHDQKGLPRPRVIAQSNILARFSRYKMTLGYNGAINSRQFGFPFSWPEEYRYPDVTYDERMHLTIGGEVFELHHALGETDDATWVWIPGKKVLCTGDMFIWATPNCGNPQKVQRYPLEWAQALREMDRKGAEFLLPGHGPPIVGATRVRQALVDTAEFLEDICKQALAAINEGLSLNEVLHSVKLPAELMKRPYLRATYDHPLFIVCNIWRRYAGWWDGVPSHLQPPKDAELGSAVVALAGSPKAVCTAAKQEAKSGRVAVACAIIDFAHHAYPDDADVKAARAELYIARAEAEACLMARNIYHAAARASSDADTKGMITFPGAQSKL